MPNYLRKLNVKDVMGGEIPTPTEPLWLCRFSGMAVRSEEVKTTFGSSTRLIGQFMGKRHADGELFESPECFLPCGMGEMIAEKLISAEGVGVSFTFDIGVKLSERPSAKEPYEYIIRSARDEHAESPLFKMLNEAPPPPVFKALPSAKSTPKGK